MTKQLAEMTDELDEESVENMAVDASEFGLSTSRSIFEELWHSISRLCFKTILFPGLLSQQAVPLEQEWPRGRVLVLASGSTRGDLVGKSQSAMALAKAASCHR